MFVILATFAVFERRARKTGIMTFRTFFLRGFVFVKPGFAKTILTIQNATLTAFCAKNVKILTFFTGYVTRLANFVFAILIIVITRIAKTFAAYL